MLLNLDRLQVEGITGLDDDLDVLGQGLEGVAVLYFRGCARELSLDLLRVHHHIFLIFVVTHQCLAFLLLFLGRSLSQLRRELLRGGSGEVTFFSEADGSLEAYFQW